jgi:dienelactone hydrolase
MSPPNKIPNRPALLLALMLSALMPVAGAATKEPVVTKAIPRPYGLAELNVNGVPPVLGGIATREQWDSKRAEILQAFLDCAGGVPARGPVKFSVESEVAEGDHARQKIVFTTADGDSVPAFLLIPKGARESGKKYPAILALHPTNAMGKASVATLEGPPNRRYALELVSRGYVVLAPDDLTAGERIFPGLAAFRDAPFSAQHPEWSTVGKNLLDHLQAVDLLASLDFVDAERIGAIGHSFGGYNVYFLSAIDERIRAVVSSCGLLPFAPKGSTQHWGVRNWYTHFPKLTEAQNQGSVPFEFNEIIALTAPRPMFFYAAQSDRIFPHWEAVGECFLDVHRLYVWLEAEDNFKSVMGSGGHDFPEPVRIMSYEFLDQWLKPEHELARNVRGRPAVPLLPSASVKSSAPAR